MFIRHFTADDICFRFVEIKHKNNKTAAVVVGRERRRSYFEKVIRPVEIGASRERYL